MASRCHNSTRPPARFPARLVATLGLAGTRLRSQKFCPEASLRCPSAIGLLCAAKPHSLRPSSGRAGVGRSPSTGHLRAASCSPPTGSPRVRPPSRPIDPRTSPPPMLAPTTPPRWRSPLLRANPGIAHPFSGRPVGRGHIHGKCCPFAGDMCDFCSSSRDLLITCQRDVRGPHAVASGRGAPRQPSGGGRSAAPSARSGEGPQMRSRPAAACGRVESDADPLAAIVTIVDRPSRPNARMDPDRSPSTPVRPGAR